MEKINPEKRKEYVDKNPDKYLCELAKEFNCSTSGVFDALKKLGYGNRRKTRVIKK